MAAKQWNVGDVLTSSDMNVWTVPVAVVKPADTARNTTTTVADDPDLVLALAASSTYRILAMIVFGGANMAVNTDPGGLKWTFTVPASATGQYISTHQNASGNVSGMYQNSWPDTSATSPAAASAATQGTGNFMGLGITGLLAVAGTAGNLTFRWAQLNSSGTNTTVKAQSFLEAQRIA